MIIIPKIIVTGSKTAAQIGALLGATQNPDGSFSLQLAPSESPVAFIDYPTNGTKAEKCTAVTGSIGLWHFSELINGNASPSLASPCLKDLLLFLEPQVETDFALSQKYLFVSGFNAAQFSAVQTAWVGFQRKFGSNLKLPTDFGTNPKEHLLRAFKETIQDNRNARKGLVESDGLMAQELERGMAPAQGPIRPAPSTNPH